ncbi:hypothetical protein D3C86_1881800 [compost metagenome]
MNHLLLNGHVAQVGACFHAMGLAGGHGFVEFFLVEIDQRQFGPFARQVFAHGAAQALAAAGDDDNFVFELHRVSPQGVSCGPAGAL